MKLADVSTGLPRRAPEFPLVDPIDPNVVYFSTIDSTDDGEGHVFGVDLSTTKVSRAAAAATRA